MKCIVYQAKCIQWGEKDYELLVNADQEKLDIDEVLAGLRFMYRSMLKVFFLSASRTMS